MVQLGGHTLGLMDNIMKPVFGMARFTGEFSGNMKHVKSGKDIPKLLLKTGRDLLNREVLSAIGSRITLTDNELKDITKVIRSLENRGILWKGTAGKCISQDGGLLNFLGLLMKVDLSLMKNVLTPLAKGVLIPLALTAAP